MKFYCILFFIFLLSSSIALGQSDSTKRAQQVQKINSIFTEAMNEQIQLRSAIDVTKKIRKNVNSASSKKRASKKKVREWYKINVDSIPEKQLDSIYDLKILQIDSAYLNTMRKAYRKKKIDNVRPFPALNGVFSALYYNGNESTRFDFLRTTTISGLQENGAFSTEIVAGYAGAFRVGFSSVLSRQKQITISNDELKDLSGDTLEMRLVQIDSINRQNNTLLKLVSGGGEGVLTARTPVLNINGNNKRASLAFETEFVGTLSGDLPIVGSYIEGSDVSIFGTVGLENQLLFRLKKFDIQPKNISEGFSALFLFGKFNARSVSGSDKFYENLGVRKGFFIIDYSFGLIIKNFNIYYMNQTFSNSINDNVGGRFGVSFIRTIE
jgi:hypothetical protein